MFHVKQFDHLERAQTVHTAFEIRFEGQLASKMFHVEQKCELFDPELGKLHTRPVKNVPRGTIVSRETI
jgi:hypothetical protein